MSLIFFSSSLFSRFRICTLHMVNYHLVSVRPVLRAVRLEQILVGVEEHAPAAVHAGDPHRQVGRLVARPHAQLDRLLGRPLPDHQPDVTPSPESGKGVSMFREMLLSSWCVDPPVHQPNLGPAVVGDRPFSVYSCHRGGDYQQIETLPLCR